MRAVNSSMSVLAVLICQQGLLPSTAMTLQVLHISFIGLDETNALSASWDVSDQHQLWPKHAKLCLSVDCLLPWQLTFHKQTVPTVAVARLVLQVGCPAIYRLSYTNPPKDRKWNSHHSIGILTFHLFKGVASHEQQASHPLSRECQASSHTCWCTWWSSFLLPATLHCHATTSRWVKCQQPGLSLLHDFSFHGLEQGNHLTHLSCGDQGSPVQLFSCPSQRYHLGIQGKTSVGYNIIQPVKMWISISDDISISKWDFESGKVLLYPTIRRYLAVRWAATLGLLHLPLGPQRLNDWDDECG